jgi:hypothetical protein
MAANEIHYGDIGTVFERTIVDGTTPVDVSSASVKQLLFSKPSGMLLTKAAVFTTDGTDGKVRYTTIAGDLDTLGWWHLQVHIEMPGGKWSSDIDAFEVHGNVA